MYIEEEKKYVADAMTKYGGNFFSKIGEALYHADTINALKLKFIFQEEWEDNLKKGKIEQEEIEKCKKEEPFIKITNKKLYDEINTCFDKIVKSKEIEIIKSYKKYLGSYPKLSKSDEIENIKTIDDVDKDFVLNYMTEELLKGIENIKEKK